MPTTTKRKRQHGTRYADTPWSRLPLHLLNDPTAGLSKARCYSTDGRDAKGELTDEQESKADTSNTPSRISSMLGFQSLSGLFQQSPRGRYSRPTRSGTTLSSAPTPLNLQPEKVVPSVPEPTFVSETAASQSDDRASAPIPQRVRYVSEDPQDASTAFAPKENTMDEPDSTLTTHTRQKTSESASRHRRLIKVYGATVPKSRPVSGRVANPFVITRSPQKRKSSNSNESWGLSKDTHQTLDSMLDPGPTNVEFKTMKYLQQSPQAVHSDPAVSRYGAKTVETSSASPFGSSAPEEPSGPNLTHVTPSGKAHMVDVGRKQHTKRIAIANAKVTFSNPQPLQLILENSNKKGDALGVARIAGIMASKRTADLIPLCHPIPISRVEVDVCLNAPGSQGYFDPANRNQYGSVTIHVVVECVGPTGVEMEALTAVSGAALTVFDMCKAVDRQITIGMTQVVYKSGGRSGVHINPRWYHMGGKEFMEKSGIDTNGLGAMTAEETPTKTQTPVRARTQKPLYTRNMKRRQ